MSYLDFIDDQSLVSAVKHVLDIAREAKNSIGRTFHSNVIDPFGAFFEAGGFKLSHDEWRKNEEERQIQKTLQNHVGGFHQTILGSVRGWQNLHVGGNVDLKCDERKIIAEIKNKYSTVTGAKLVNEYQSLERLIMPKASVYWGYTAYFVTIIPKNPERINREFTPSNRDSATRCASNEKIRIIDGASFYDLVTNKKNSLKALYDALPQVIEDIYGTYYPNEKFSFKGRELFAEYFARAYGDNHD